MHERSLKNNHLDTILYEIDMLRHCACTLDDKKANGDHSAFDRAEYYLGIEGFLLHLRNVLAFFASRRGLSTDLTLNKPEDWANRSVDPREYSDLAKGVKEIDKAYGEDSTCY